MTIHELKTVGRYFQEVLEGKKTFELRKDDRGFKVGDILRLREWTVFGGYTGRAIDATITSIIRGAGSKQLDFPVDLSGDPEGALSAGWVVMSMRRNITLPRGEEKGTP